jgi:hypothetical protein
MVKRNLKRTVVNCGMVFAVVLLQLLVSCNIFSPRDSESPAKEGGGTDPLGFAAIMGNTGQTFTKLRYEDLFLDNDSVYNDFNSGRYSKTQLMQRLQQIVQDTLIKVLWQTGKVWKNAGIDTMILSELKYYIFPDGTTSGAPLDSGSSNFTVIYKQDWFISKWVDVPSGANKSFFAP